jgi:hypothetical protein
MNDPQPEGHMASHIERRKFLATLGGAAATWPLSARAQEPGRIYRLGCLHASPRDAPHHLALFDELRRLGFTDGQNLVVDAAGYGMSAERFAVHAADLVQTRVILADCCASEDDVHKASAIAKTRAFARRFIVRPPFRMDLRYAPRHSRLRAAVAKRGNNTRARRW